MLKKIYFSALLLLRGLSLFCVDIQVYRIKANNYYEYHESRVNLDDMKLQDFRDDSDELEYLENRYRQAHRSKNDKYYKSIKWGFDQPFNIWYILEETIPPPINSIIYEVIKTKSNITGKYCPFFKVAHDSISIPVDFLKLLEYPICNCSDIGLSNDVSDSIYVVVGSKCINRRFLVSGSDLVVYFNDSSPDTLFAKGRITRTVFGRIFHTRDYKQVKFMGHTFRNISEFYLNEDKDGIIDVLFWFDDEYNLIRLDAINGLYGKGLIIVR